MLVDRRQFLASGAALAVAGPALLQTPAYAADGPILTDDGLYKEPWFLESFLELPDDLEGARKAGKRFAIMWELRGCPYCKETHFVNFAQPRISDYVKSNFEMLQLNIIGSRKVTDFDGEELSEKQLAAKYGVRFTPTFQFFPDTLDGRFAVLATVVALALVRLEQAGTSGNDASVALTERFIAVMESEHRELGLGDPTLGKTVRKLVGSLGRRTALWRSAVAGEGPWSEAARDSLYRGAAPPEALRHCTAALERLCARLPELLPERPACLTHGDLWTQNVLATADGRPALIDSAVSYTWAEVDLAHVWTTAPPPEATGFFGRYAELTGLDAGWRERMPILQLRQHLAVIAQFEPDWGAADHVRATLAPFRPRS